MLLEELDNLGGMLAKMSPQQRQQFAAMHHNDPYIVSLTKFVNDTEQKQAQALRNQQLMGQQQPPKVNEQVIAGMAPPPQMPQMPEDMGIAALPAPNLAQMADGGIVGGYDDYDMGVGYAEGGMVEHYAPGGSTAAMQQYNAEFKEFLRKMGMSVAEYRNAAPDAKAAVKEMFTQQRGTTPSGFDVGKAAAEKFGEPLKKAASAAKNVAGPLLGGAATAAYGLGEVESAKGFYEDPNVPISEKVKQFLRTGAKTALPYVGGAIGSGVAPVLGTAGGVGAGMGLSALIDPQGEALQEWKKVNWKDPAAWAKFEADLSAQVQAGTMTEQVKQTLLADAERNKVAAPTVNIKQPVAPAPAPAPGTAPTADTGRKPAVPTPTKQTADDMVQQYQTLMTKLKADDPAAAQRAELAALIEGRGRADLEELVKTQKSGAERLKGREERYAAQEAKLAKSADTNTGLALLMAAGAVLEGRGLGQGLARAAKVAIPQYQEGLAKMQAAQERINEGRDRLEELRQNYDDLNAKEIRAAKRQIHDDLITAKKLGIDGIMAAQGVKEKQAATIFDGLVRNQITDLAGQYSVSAAAARGSETSDFRLAQLATNIRNKANEAADKQYLQGPARAQFIEAEIAKYAQSVPGLAEYMGVTGGGGVPLPQGVTVRKVGD